MLAISCRQLEFCQREDGDPGDLTEFTELVSQRQLLMDEIDRLDVSLPEPGSAEDSSVADSSDTACHNPAGNKQLRVVIEAIRRNDDICLRLLQERLDELAAGIRQTRASRQAADAYSQGQVIHEAWFVDKKK